MGVSVQFWYAVVTVPDFQGWGAAIQQVPCGGQPTQPDFVGVGAASFPRLLSPPSNIWGNVRNDDDIPRWVRPVLRDASDSRALYTGLSAYIPPKSVGTLNMFPVSNQQQPPQSWWDAFLSHPKLRLTTDLWPWESTPPCDFQLYTSELTSAALQSLSGVPGALSLPLLPICGAGLDSAGRYMTLAYGGAEWPPVIRNGSADGYSNYQSAPQPTGAACFIWYDARGPYAPVLRGGPPNTPFQLLVQFGMDQVNCADLGQLLGIQPVFDANGNWNLDQAVGVEFNRRNFPQMGIDAFSGLFLIASWTQRTGPLRLPQQYRFWSMWPVFPGAAAGYAGDAIYTPTAPCLRR